MKKNAIRQYVDEILSKETTTHYHCQEPKWIREKKDAKRGDTVTVYGIESKLKEKPFPHYEEGCAVISHKRVYNGTLLCFDGKEWIQIAGGKIC